MGSYGGQLAARDKKKKMKTYTVKNYFLREKNEKQSITRSCPKAVLSRPLVTRPTQTKLPLPIPLCGTSRRATPRSGAMASAPLCGPAPARRGAGGAPGTALVLTLSRVVPPRDLRPHKRPITPSLRHRQVIKSPYLREVSKTTPGPGFEQVLRLSKNTIKAPGHMPSPLIGSSDQDIRSSIAYKTRFEIRHKTGGRNHTGKITVRHRDGQGAHKRKFRPLEGTKIAQQLIKAKVPNLRAFDGQSLQKELSILVKKLTSNALTVKQCSPSTFVRMEYNPNTSGNIALCAPILGPQVSLQDESTVARRLAPVGPRVGLQRGYYYLAPHPLFLSYQYKPFDLSGFSNVEKSLGQASGVSPQENPKERPTVGPGLLKNQQTDNVIVCRPFLFQKLFAFLSFLVSKEPKAHPLFREAALLRALGGGQSAGQGGPLESVGRGSSGGKYELIIQKPLKSLFTPGLDSSASGPSAPPKNPHTVPDSKGAFGPKAGGPFGTGPASRPSADSLSSLNGQSTGQSPRTSGFGSNVFNIELSPGRGGQVARAAGCSATLIKSFVDPKTSVHKCVLKLPSKALVTLNSDCLAFVGLVSNPTHYNRILGKAGASR